MVSFNIERLERIKSKCGVDLIGLAKADILHREKEYFSKWLEDNKHGSMTWMENYKDKRFDPGLLMDDTKSLIVFAMNYFSSRQSKDNGNLISNYVTEFDYHKVLKKKGYELLLEMQKSSPDLEGRVFVDTAPVMEKIWAAKAGIGWQGKHTNIISRSLGSWIFLGVILVNVEFDNYSQEAESLCGSCTKCMDACPTQAIIAPYELDASKCISYQTIENRNEYLDDDLTLSGWIYGCDICQSVCPWNIKFEKTTESLSLGSAISLNAKSHKFWHELGEKNYKKHVKKTAMSRQSYKNILRNIEHNSLNKK